MTEAEARQWLVERFDPAAIDKLETFATILRSEAAKQNLVAESTLDHLWARHIVDSAQLIDFARDAPSGEWLDIGSGAGLPGVVAAILQPRSVLLVEPRRGRAAFLEEAVARLNLNATVRMTKVERLARGADTIAIISARAVAALPALLGSAIHLAGTQTRWLLPKGRSAREEVALARAAWQGVFHVEQSVTAPDSAVIVAHGVRRR